MQEWLTRAPQGKRPSTEPVELTEPKANGVMLGDTVCTFLVTLVDGLSGVGGIQGGCRSAGNEEKTDNNHERVIFQRKTGVTNKQIKQPSPMLSNRPKHRRSVVRYAPLDLPPRPYTLILVFV